MPTKLPPFTILHIVLSDLLEDLGEDVVYFDVDLELNGTDYHTMISMMDFVDYLSSSHPEQGAYLEKIRNGMKGFGPKETAVYNTAIEEGFDFEPWVYRFIEDIRPLEHLDFKHKPTTTPEEHQNVEGILDDLSALAGAAKSFRIREVEFSDALMDYVTESVAKIFPEIFNSDPEYITQLQSILMKGVMDMSSRVSDLAYQANEEI